MRGRARWVVLVALLAGAAGGFGLPTAGAAGSVCGPGGTVADIGNGWLASRPTFPSGDQGVTMVAAAAYDSNLVYASNGSVVMRSTDAACSWTTVFTASDVSQGVPGARVLVTALAVPSSANSSSFVYVGVTASNQGVPKPAVAVSRDRGKTFTTTGLSEGLPAIGWVQEVAANPTIPQIAYATVSTRLNNTVLNTQVYGTSDGATTWTDRTGSGGGTDVTDLVTDPLGQTGLYATSSGAVVHSTDGGATFTPVSGSPGRSISKLTASSGAGGLRLAVLRSDSSVATSPDGGASWSRITSGLVPAALAVMPVRAVIGETDGHAVLLVPAVAGSAPADVSPTAPGLFGSLSLTAPTGSGFAAIGLRDGAVARAAVTNALTTIAVPGSGPGGRLRPVSLQPPGVLGQFPSTLLPPAVTVSLPAGGSREIPYDLLVPRTPTPVDVMFLVDSTGSMSSVIDELKARLTDIVNTLDQAGLDVRFGIGDYRDYPAPYGVGARGDWPYRLDRVVGPVDSDLADAIRSLHTGGGTTDGDASPLTALTQAATGAGDAIDDEVFVDPGQQAGYRPYALKLAMLAGDTYAHYGGERVDAGNGRMITNPGPTFDSTTEALLAHGVEMIGLAVGSTPVHDWRHIARDSNSLAPRQGVDCNGDGLLDLRADDPLVCQIGDGSSTGAVGVGVSTSSSGSATGLTAAVEGLAATIPDVKPVRLSVTQGAAFARLVSPASHVVDLHADNQLGYEIEVTCPLGPAAHRTIELTARTPSRRLATGSVDLTCGGVPVPAPVAAVPLAAAAAAAPPAPAAPAQPAPNPNPNPNPNLNPATNVNPGVAQQDNEQQQLAFAEDQGSESLAMSAWGFVAVAGLMSCVAGGLALRRRTALQPTR